MKPKVLVCQIGARHRYMIPKLFENLGILSHLYTDSSQYSRLGKIISILPVRFNGPLLRLVNRKIREIPPSKIYSIDGYIYKENLRRFLGVKKTGIARSLDESIYLSGRFITKGIQDANIIYSMNRSCLDFVKFAKGKGAKSIIDVFISPETDEIMEQEAKIFQKEINHEQVDKQISTKMWLDMGDVADILLCPSDWVAQGVKKIMPQYQHKIRIVPYGCSIDFSNKINSPIKGRILFSGGDIWRKGLQYLAQAISEIKNTRTDIELYVAGMVDEQTQNNAIFKDVNFLGKLTLEDMKNEYLKADIFVLPSLSEGFAGVIAEAMTAGCPIIVTKESGSGISDGIEGCLVPIRDVSILIDKIEMLVDNRELRDLMAKNSKKFSNSLSLASWQKHLDNLIKEF
jgi:glycosyltransferase involved in cell wall biosynthesis